MDVDDDDTNHSAIAAAAAAAVVRGKRHGFFQRSESTLCLGCPPPDPFQTPMHEALPLADQPQLLQPNARYGSIQYRVTLVVAYLGWFHSDYLCSTSMPCQPACFAKSAQAEGDWWWNDQNQSTQPRCATTRVTLYTLYLVVKLNCYVILDLSRISSNLTRFTSTLRSNLPKYDQ